MAAIIIVVSLSLSLTACEVKKNVPTSFFKEYKSDIMQHSNVKNVKLSFKRPAVMIEVYVTKVIDETEINKILELTKSYVTVENMNNIAKRVKWDREISRVYLRIINNADKSLLIYYGTNYFKTNDASDYTPDNIDEYKTWKNLK